MFRNAHTSELYRDHVGSMFPHLPVDRKRLHLYTVYFNPKQSGEENYIFYIRGCVICLYFILIKARM